MRLSGRLPLLNTSSETTSSSPISTKLSLVKTSSEAFLSSLGKVLTKLAFPKTSVNAGYSPDDILLFLGKVALLNTSDSEENIQLPLLVIC